MSIDFNFPVILVFALIANGVFASSILLLKKENQTANRYLSTLTFILSLWLCDTFFRIAGIYEQQPNYYFLPIYFSFGFGPLIYFYTLQLTKKEFNPSYRLFFHFIPVLFQFLFYCYLQLETYAFRRSFWLEIHRPFTYNFELALSFILLMAYLALSRFQIIKYRKQIENSFSDVSRITLKWLNQLHILLFVLSFFWLFETIGRVSWDLYPVTPFSSLSIGLVILFIAIGGILQKDLSSTTKTLSNEGFESIGHQKEHDDENEVINPKEVVRIKQILVEKELFLISDITLKNFSTHVGLPPRETSRLINRGLNMSFIDFINSYRVERFKELADSKKTDHLSLLGMAYDSGFNSKSTFNRVFKKMEGKSPSAYLNES
jgi:AraC-like DNA-binding protein